MNFDKAIDFTKGFSRLYGKSLAGGLASFSGAVITCVVGFLFVAGADILYLKYSGYNNPDPITPLYFYAFSRVFVWLASLGMFALFLNAFVHRKRVWVGFKSFITQSEEWFNNTVDAGRDKTPKD